MSMFKQVLRLILQTLAQIQPSNRLKESSFIVHDADPVSSSRISQQEFEILFDKSNPDYDLSFMHNDLKTSNIIVNNGKIVGIVDWEMAGFFGWRTARIVHETIRTRKWEDFADELTTGEPTDPRQKEKYLKLKLKQRIGRDVFWNDLYI
jgi:aminoglycoside phosphotransferase